MNSITLSVVTFRFLIVFTLRGSCEPERSCDERCFRVTALIPARAGSKGIKDKNLSILGNETLIERTLRIVNKCGKFDSVWVSTDGEEIAKVATKQGANVHKRHSATATDDAATLLAVEDFLLNPKVADSQIVAVVQCTSPFIRSDFLCEALDYIIKYDVDCVFSVTRSHQLRWTEKKGFNPSPLNFDPKFRPRRQDWSGELIENGMFYFAKTKMVLEQKTLQNDKYGHNKPFWCGIFEIPKNRSLEIDTEFDLNLARMMLSLFEE